MIGHIGRARKGPRANADLKEYSNYRRRSPERLVGVQLRGGLWGMDRRARSRTVDCCSSACILLVFFALLTALVWRRDA